MKFSEYKNSETEKSSGKNQGLDKNQERLLKSFLKNYEGKNKNDIIAEIIKVAEKNRREGNLTDSDLDNFANMLYPMLNAEQKRELSDIIARLKA